MIVSFCEPPRTRASYDVRPSAAERLEGIFSSGHHAKPKKISVWLRQLSWH